MRSSTYHIFFGNLANPLRIDVIIALRLGKKNVSELMNEIGVEQSKLSHALTGLRNCNLVNYEKNGKERIYSLNRKTILPILKIIDKHAKEFCNGECKSCSCFKN